MSSIDSQFINDLEQCLKAADQLGEVDTEETRLFVSKQLQDLHDFLQKKQRDAEKRVEEEIKKEEDEIRNLEQRIERVTKSDGTHESDIAYSDIGLLWLVLKDEYWQLAFNAFISETTDDVKTIMEKLIAILQASLSHCKMKAKDSRKKMMLQVYFPGEDAQKKRDLKLPKNDTNLESLCKNCQVKSTPFCLPSILEVNVSDVKADRMVANHFKEHQSNKVLKKALDKFLEKCVEFAWMACFEEPEVRLITNPTKECKNISSQFIGLNRTTHRAREDFAIVEWPAVVQGDKIRIPWTLYTLKQPRPQAKDMRGEPSDDYRVTRTEDRDGVLVNDNEDNDATRDKVYTASGTQSNKQTQPGVSAETDKKVQRGNKDVADAAKDIKGPNHHNSRAYKRTNQGHKNTQF